MRRPATSRADMYISRIQSRGIRCHIQQQAHINVSDSREEQVLVRVPSGVSVPHAARLRVRVLSSGDDGLLFGAVPTLQALGTLRSGPGP